METFLVQNQVFTIEEARNALEIEKNRSTLNNLLAYHLQKGISSGFVKAFITRFQEVLMQKLILPTLI